MGISKEARRYTLTYACQLNQANPLDYLTQSQRHADQLAAGPQLWLP